MPDSFAVLHGRDSCKVSMQRWHAPIIAPRIKDGDSQRVLRTTRMHGAGMSDDPWFSSWTSFSIPVYDDSLD